MIVPPSFSVPSENNGGEEGRLERLFVWVGAHGLVLVFPEDGESKRAVQRKPHGEKAGNRPVCVVNTRRNGNGRGYSQVV